MASENNSSIKTVDDGVQAIAQQQQAYLDSLKQQKDANEQHRISDHERVHRIVASSYAIATALLADEDLLAKVLAKLHITVRAGTNPYYPIVKAIYRRPRKGGGTEFNPSAKKYANSLRFFRDNEWPQDQIVERLGSLKLEVNGKTYGKLKATEEADRAKYNEVDDIDAFEEAAFIHLFDQPVDPIAIDEHLELEAPTDGQFIAVAMSYDAATSRWYPRALMEKNSATVRKEIRKRVIAKFKLDYDVFVMDLAQANAETETANSMPPAMRELIRKQKERQLAADHPLDSELFQEPDSVSEGSDEALALAAGN